MQDLPHNVRLMAWLKVFRVPNLFTVPGDPAAGFLLAAGGGVPAGGWWALGWVSLSSLLLYMAGLASNDYFDLEEDRRDRPDRPLPSGAVNPAAALTAAVVLAVAGLGAAALASMSSLGVAVVLLACVAAYNMRLKHYRVIGPLGMGLCRGLSLLLGAAAAVPCPPAAGGLVLVAAGGLVAYIMAVTAIAADETKRQRLSVRRWMPAAVILVVLAWLGLERISGAGTDEKGLSLGVALACSVLTLGVALKCGRVLKGTPEPAVVARTIGRFIRVLIPFQATLATLAAWSGPSGWMVAAIIMALWPMGVMTGRKFYAS
jgi:4-hydroxybenzoate polyprenyltransferase